MQSQSPQPQPGKQSSREYFIGIGIGFVPLVLALVSIGGLFAGTGTGIGSILFGTGLGIAVLLYVALFVASIICLCIKRSRYVGYGLLTMVVAIPVISFIGCLVSITGPHI
jgi:hypothetical protein